MGLSLGIFLLILGGLFIPGLSELDLVLLGFLDLLLLSLLQLARLRFSLLISLRVELWFDFAIFEVLFLFFLVVDDSCLITLRVGFLNNFILLLLLVFHVLVFVLLLDLLGLAVQILLGLDEHLGVLSADMNCWVLHGLDLLIELLLPDLILVMQDLHAFRVHLRLIFVLLFELRLRCF